MKEEKEYLEQTLDTLRAERSQLTVLLKDGQQKADGRIDALIKASPLWEQIQAIKAEFEKFKETLQRKNDHLGGKIEGLNALYDEYYRFAVEPGTKMYGIDISRLDWQTRARVMEGHRQTILMLGGNPDAPAHLTIPAPPPPVVVPAPAPPPPAPPPPAPVVPPAPPAPPPEPPNPQPAPRVVSPTEPLSTRALLAQQQREREQAAEKTKEEAAQKEKAPEAPEPSRKRKR